MADPLEAMPFSKRLAILISRSLNTLNPNEVLAKTVFSLSKHHTLPTFSKAIASFGKFSSADAQEIFDLCQQQDTIEDAFSLSGSSGGLTITDSDVLQPDVAQGRPGLSVGEDKHVFKAPAVPRQSALGLDRLAAEKRKERGDGPVGSVKRIKYDEEDEVQPDEFKSALSSSPLPSARLKYIVADPTCSPAQFPPAPYLARATFALAPTRRLRTQEASRKRLARSSRSIARERPNPDRKGWSIVGMRGSATSRARRPWRASGRG